MSLRSSPRRSRCPYPSPNSKRPAVGIPQVQTLDMYLQAPQIAPVIMQQPALPMAAMGFDRTRDGRVDTLVVGQDLNRDGIPDVLERSPVTYGGGLAPTIQATSYGGGMQQASSYGAGMQPRVVQPSSYVGGGAVTPARPVQSGAVYGGGVGLTQRGGTSQQQGQQFLNNMQDRHPMATVGITDDMFDMLDTQPL